MKPACSLKRRGWGAAVTGLLLATIAHADAPTPTDIVNWLQPDRVQQATLSPDGRHLAYTAHEDDQTFIAIVDVDDPSKRSAVPAGKDSIIRDSQDHEKTPVEIPFFRWAASDRIVFESRIPGIQEVDVRRTHEPTDVSIVYSVGADGKNLRKLVDADDLALTTITDDKLPRQPHVLGLASDEPDVILVQAVRPALDSGSNDPSLYGRIATGMFKVNVRTGQRRTVNEQDVNGDVLYDRQGRPRIKLLRPIDSATQSFVYVPLAGQPAAKGIDRLVADDITPQTYLGSRTFPLGFDYDPKILYIASNVGRDTYGIYALDLRAGQRTGLAVEDPAFDLADFTAPGNDAALVFDRSQRRLVGVRLATLEDATRWLDPEIADMQSSLEKKFPGRAVRIIDWDDHRKRFLLLASGGADPGRYYVFHRDDNRLVQFVRRTQGVDLDATNASAPFAFDTPAGVHLTGYLTQPVAPLANPPPLLVYCHGGPWERSWPGFNRDAQVLAAMGFVVAQVNYRGSGGFGTRMRETLRTNLDGMPVEDIRSVVDWVAARQKVDRKRVALIGEGFGGYVVLRALQLYPDDFRCAVAINAPTDLETWARKPESVQEARDRQDTNVNQMHAMADFLTHFGPPGNPLLAPTPNPAPSFAQDGIASLTDDQTAASVTAASAGGAPAQPPMFPPTLINFASEFRSWYFGTDAKHLAEISPSRHADLITKPVLLIQDPYDPSGEAGAATALRSALARGSNPADYLEITNAYARGLPNARQQVFAKVEEFFNLNVYNFNVKIGDTKVQR
ncbi:MAG TPA: alpha/beta fold hydrolase [Opitutaceae bacterium]|nr:alpha/beta fold hydrolase [Opitutaceae bacterium]